MLVHNGCSFLQELKDVENQEKNLMTESIHSLIIKKLIIKKLIVMRQKVWKEIIELKIVFLIVEYYTKLFENKVYLVCIICLTAHEYKI